MPGWHAKTETLVEEGKLQVAGIVQEQHPDRALLYMQWKQMGWPVLADPSNELGIKVVPITLLIDRHGIIRFRNPKEDDLREFIGAVYENDAPKQPKKKLTATQHIFKKGVFYRQRYDSPERVPGDFEKAIRHWRRALNQDPDQYIYRRRIQQYGPRLDKPYSFYDWVNRAREEITARGEVPHPLAAEPGGSEFAYPSGKPEDTTAPAHPDPDGKVTRDSLPLVSLRPVTVPSTKGDGEAFRVHIQLTPRAEKDVHWSDEAGPMQFFLDPGSPLTLHEFEAPITTATGGRTMEFEIRPTRETELPESIQGAVFYYICEGAGGTCLYLRNDIVIPLR